MPKATGGSFKFWEPENLHGGATAGHPRLATSQSPAMRMVMPGMETVAETHERSWRHINRNGCVNGKRRHTNRSRSDHHRSRLNIDHGRRTDADRGGCRIDWRRIVNRHGSPWPRPHCGGESARGNPHRPGHVIRRRGLDAEGGHRCDCHCCHCRFHVDPFVQRSADSTSANCLLFSRAAWVWCPGICP